jgi:hypothetical protein
LVEVLLVAFNVSVLVVLAFSVFPAIVWPVKLETVVDASVDEPLAARLVKDARVA